MKSKIYSLLFNRDSKKLSNQKKFLNVMRRAKLILGSSGNDGLRDLIKIILRPIQSEHIRSAYTENDHCAKTELSLFEGLNIEGVIPQIRKNLLDYYFSSESTINIENESLFPLINLATDIILPTCWSPESIVQTIGVIGEGLPCGKFIQNTDHSVSHTYPLGINWVSHKNHSIAQGVIRGQGVITPDTVHDLTEIIDIIYYDGTNWRCKKTIKNLGKPIYPEFGWAWEIGRLIAENEPNPFK